MKLIIAGTRTLDVNDEMLNGLIDHFLLDPDEVVSGGCRGVDGCGVYWGKMRRVPVKEFPAKWDQYGDSAGPIRNAVMAEYADALLLVWDGHSRGSKSMLDEMKKRGKRVYEAVLIRH